MHPSRLNLDLTGNESAKNCSSMDSQAFEKFENAIFFKIFKLPYDRQLILVSNLTKIFFEKKFGLVLDPYQLSTGRNFEYLEKDGFFKFFKSL